MLVAKTGGGGTGIATLQGEGWAAYHLPPTEPLLGAVVFELIVGAPLGMRELLQQWYNQGVPQTKLKVHTPP